MTSLHALGPYGVVLAHAAKLFEEYCRGSSSAARAKAKANTNYSIRDLTM